MAQSIGKAIKMTQVAKSLIFGDNGPMAYEFATENYALWRDVPLAVKAAVEATSWADLQNSTVWQEVVDQFIEQIRPYSVFDSMAPSMAMAKAG